MVESLNYLDLAVKAFEGLIWIVQPTVRSRCSLRLVTLQSGVNSGTGSRIRPNYKHDLKIIDNGNTYGTMSAVHDSRQYSH